MGTVDFFALKDIPAGSEIFTNYNGDPKAQYELWFKVKEEKSKKKKEQDKDTKDKSDDIDSNKTNNNDDDADDDDNDNFVSAMDHQSIFIGQPALKDVKAQLDKKGYSARFDSGTLIVNDVISIRKDGTDEQGVPILRVEGAFCDDYFAIRDLVYGNFIRL